MDTFKEGVGSIIEDGHLVGIIHRDPTSGHQVFYKCTEMGLDDICEVLEKFKNGSHGVCKPTVENPVDNQDDTVLNSWGQNGKKVNKIRIP